MKYAFKNTIPVTPRGSGTGLVGASVAMEHGIMIDTSLMNHFLRGLLAGYKSQLALKFQLAFL